MKAQITCILTFSLTTLLLSCTTNQHKNYVDSNRGQIKFITQFGYKAAEKHGNAPIDELETKTTLQYDEKGNLVEMNAYDIKTNEVFSKEKRVYDTNRNMIEITFYNFKGEIDGKYIYKYDNRNNEVEKNTYWKGRFDGKVITNYDYEKMVVKVNFYYADGRLSNTSSYKIDNRGNHLEDYNSNGNIASKTNYEYDNKGNILKELCEAWEPDSTKGIVSYQYDEWNNVIKRTYTETSGVKPIITSAETKYTYDKSGNWLKSVKTYSWDDIRETNKREIEYY